MNDKRLLTIQDISCVGQCSLTVALPIISACGVECAILPSSVLSNHTAGFSGWTFCDLTDEMPNILAQWKKEKVDFDAFYTGYVSKTQIPHILDIMQETARLGALRIVGPVMGDGGKLYPGFDDDFPQEMCRLCNGADVIMPNLTEAALLLGEEYRTEYDQTYIEQTIKRLHATPNLLGSRLTPVSTTFLAPRACRRLIACSIYAWSYSVRYSSPSRRAASVRLGMMTSAPLHRRRISSGKSSSKPGYSLPPSPITGSTMRRAPGRAVSCMMSRMWGI